MKLILTTFIMICGVLNAQHLKTPFEKGNGNQTTTYEEMLRFYNELDEKSSEISIVNIGKDDNGEPIKVVLFSSKTLGNTSSKPTILINNGIHPGEPDGIDATMMLMRDFAEGKIKTPENVQIATIQCYNISGMLRRNKHSRANQNGPEEYGFRGNARNFDLNRDFIKNDTENAKSFQEIVQWLKPIYFIDNHVSNGADYQYIYTYISTNKERLGKGLGAYFHDEMQPEIVKNLEKKGILSVPYVNIHGDSPDDGFPAFMDSPRYATGYTTLFNIPGTVAETHMLKPYKNRVKATYENMKFSIEFVDENGKKINDLRKEEYENVIAQKKYPIQWKLDSTKYKKIDFKGFEAEMKPSEVTGKQRLFYNREKPFSRKVKFFDTYVVAKEILVPKAYVIPQSEYKVIEHFKRNQIEMSKIKQDTIMDVEVYKIENFSTVQKPYEGHYLHYNTEVSSKKEKRKFRKGDFIVYTKQFPVKYILETLEPEAVDSFFNWNFFDGILSQKEYYSDYVFEDTAAQLLQNNPKLKSEFETKKKSDKSFFESPRAQLDWIYYHSPNYEGSVNEYPIFRISE